MRPAYRAAIFDFDGTVVDSSEGICKCAQYALDTFGIHEWLKDLTNFVGPPLISEFNKYAHDEEKAAEMVRLYTERYKRLGRYELFFFPGIGELLDRLRAAGCETMIASSKHLREIEAVLEKGGLLDRFDAVIGPVESDDPMTKTDSIDRVLGLLGSSRGAQDVCMIGDRFYDAQGALECGIPFIAALYGGIADESEFADYPNTYFAHTVDQLGELLLEA